MVNARARGKLVLLDTYKSPSTAATYTFTPNTPLTGTKYDHLIMHIVGGATAALALELILNAASGYEWDIIENDSTTVTATRNTSDTDIELISAGLIDTGGRAFDVYIKLSFNLANSQIAFSWTGGAAGEGNVTGSGMLAATTITSINIATSTSTWKANTTIKTYGVTI